MKIFSIQNTILLFYAEINVNCADSITNGSERDVLTNELLLQKGNIYDKMWLNRSSKCANFINKIILIILFITDMILNTFFQVIEIEYAKIEFPSVTVCNLQPVSLSSAEVLVKDTSTRFHRWTNIIQGFRQGTRQADDPDK